MDNRTGLKPLRVTDGGRALRVYLTKIGQSVPDFCVEHGLDRIMVQRSLNGNRERFSVDFALAIQKATRGAVKVAMWSKATLRSVDDGEPVVLAPTGTGNV